MLYRKDYEVIAEIISQRIYEWENRDCIDPELLVHDLARYFEVENLQFSREKFLKACGL